MAIFQQMVKRLGSYFLEHGPFRLENGRSVALSQHFVPNCTVCPKISRLFRGGRHEVFCAAANVGTTQLWSPILGTFRVGYVKLDIHAFSTSSLLLYMASSPLMIFLILYRFVYVCITKKFEDCPEFLPANQLRCSHSLPGWALGVDPGLCKPRFVAAIILGTGAEIWNPVSYRWISKPLHRLWIQYWL